MDRRRAWILAAVLAAIVIAGLVIRHRTVATWPRLRDAEQAFQLTAGLPPGSRSERGSSWCLISCGGDGEATIEVNYTVYGMKQDEAKRLVRSTFERLYGEVSPPELIGRGEGDVYARMPQVAKAAWAVAGAYCESENEPSRCRIFATFSSGVE